MFVHLATRAAESDETYFMAVNNAEKLAEDVEKGLKIRADSDVGTLSHSQGSYSLSNNCVNTIHMTPKSNYYLFCRYTRRRPRYKTKRLEG